MKERFSNRLGNLSVYMTLASVEKSDDESILVYLDRLRGLGKRGSVGDRELIAFAIKGLKNKGGEIFNGFNISLTNWNVFYEACKLKESYSSIISHNKEVDQVMQVTKRRDCRKKFRNNPIESPERRVDQRVRVTNRRNCMICGKKCHWTSKCMKKQGSGEIKEARSDLCIEIDGARSRPECVVHFVDAGFKIKALIDTGSDLSLLSLDAAGGMEISRSNTKVVAADGLPLDVIGVAENVLIELQNEKYNVNFTIVKNLSRGCIIGFDLLKKEKAKIICNKIELKNSIGTHKIDTGNEGPVFSPMYRQGPKMDAEIKKMVNELLSQGIIRPSTSPWRSPVVMVPKGECGWRMCIDYRRLNDITKIDAYPMPHMDDIFDALAGSRIFSKMDALSGYHQVSMAEEDIEKTAFGCKEGAFEYVKMPFGLVNAPATFQRIMDMALEEEKWKFVVIYLDDVIIYSKSEKEHAEHVRIVQEKLSKIGMIFNKEKCKFFQKEIRVLGHVVSEDGIKPDEERVRAIKQFKVPETKRELMSFLGLVGYCRKFIKDLSIISKPLYDLLKESVSKTDFIRLIRSPEIIRVMEEVKKSIADDALLALPTSKDKFILTTDASCIGIGAVLSQVQNNQEKVISYYSSLHNAAQKNYSTTEQELLAVVSAIDYFRPYLIGNKFELRTDHKALVYLFKCKDLKTRLMRWSLKLQEYQVEINYLKGEENFTDILSRAFVCDAVSVVRGKRELVIPEVGDESEIIKQYHEASGHGGIDTVKYLVLTKYSFKNSSKKIEEFIKNCSICSKAKGFVKQKSCSPIVSNAVNDLWEMDLIGPLSPSRWGHRYILTIIDTFSRRAEAFAIRDKSAETVLNFLKVVTNMWGFPKKLLSDNGLEFKNCLMGNYCESKGIELKHGSPYNPETQGSIERLNQTITRKLKKMTNFGEIDWAVVLPKAVIAYNNSYSRAIDSSPCQLFGERMTVSIDSKYFGSNDESMINTDEEQAKARLKILRYRDKIKKDAKEDEIIELYDQILYAIPSENLDKLSTVWKYKGTVVEKLFKAYKVLTEDNKLIIVNMKYIKKDKI